MLRVNKRLKRLVLSGTGLGMSAVCAISAALQDSNSTLEALDLSNALAFSCKDEPATWFARCGVLLGGAGTTQPAAAAVAAAASRPSRAEPSLPSRPPRSVLAIHPALTALSLARCRLHDSGLETLVTYGVLRNGTLRYLDLSSSRLTEESGVHIARLLAANTTVATLKLSCNELHDNGAAAIAAALPQCSTLLELDLSFNGIGDKALRSLAYGLADNDSVASIRLWGNLFGHASASAFGVVLQERAQADSPLDADFCVYEVDGSSAVAKVAAVEVEE